MDFKCRATSNYYISGNTVKFKMKQLEIETAIIMLYMNEANNVVFYLIHELHYVITSIQEALNFFRMPV